MIKRVLCMLLVLVMILGLMPKVLTAAKAATAGDGTYTWPVSTSFGISGSYSTSHGGFDLGAPIGSAVYAVADGTVILATDYGCQGSHYDVKTGWCPLGDSCAAKQNKPPYGSYANWIIIDHGNNVYSLYAHLKTGSFQVAQGQTVKQGQQIALSGNAGKTKSSSGNGAHLHFELRIGKNAFSNGANPSSYLTKVNVTPPPSYVDVGTNFYAYIIFTDAWKMLTNDQPNVSIRAETATPNQVWYFERLNDGSYKITSVLDGLCLDVYGASTSAGANVQTYGCNGTAAQQWYFFDASDALYFKAKCADTVLDVNGGFHDEGTDVQMWTQHGLAAQKFRIWKLENYMPPVNIGTNFHAVISNQSAQLPIANSYTEGEKPPVRLAGESGYADQLWRFERQSDGSYKIASCYDGKYLDVRDASCEENTVIQTCVGNEYDAQKWYILQANGGYVFKSKLSNYVMDVVNGNNTVGNHVQTYGYNGSGAQIWSINSTDAVQLRGPVLSVAAGDSATATKFTWDEVYGESRYDVKIWPGALWEGDPYHVEWGAKSGYEIVLPEGTYHAYVDAGNYFDCKMSNEVIFTVGEKNYSVSYDANGGSNAPETQTKGHNKSLTLSSAVPTREDYTFLGWADSPDATEASHQPGTEFTQNADTTLYAVWVHNHSYVSVVTAPTCADAGYTTYTCECGDSYVADEVAATGEHTDADRDKKCDICKTDVTLAARYPYGDANGDGSVNLKDVTVLRRMLSQGDVDLDLVDGNPDANGDGVVNMKDVTILRRYLAGGWGVELPV